MSDPERKSERPNQVIIMAPEDAPIMDPAKVVSDFREILGKRLTDPEEIELNVERMKRLFPAEGIVRVPRSNQTVSDGIILEVTENPIGKSFLKFDVGVETKEGIRTKSVMAKGLLDLNPEGAKDSPLKDLSAIDPNERYFFKGHPVKIAKLTNGGHYALISRSDGHTEWAACDKLELLQAVESAPTPISKSKPTEPGRRKRGRE
jgi:hypothetical protein